MIVCLKRKACQQDGMAVSTSVLELAAMPTPPNPERLLTLAGPLPQPQPLPSPTPSKRARPTTLAVASRARFTIGPDPNDHIYSEIDEPVQQPDPIVQQPKVTVL